MFQRDRLLGFLFTMLSLIILIGGTALWSSPAHALFSTHANKGEKGLTGGYTRRGENIRRVTPQELQKDKTWKSFLAQNGEKWRILRDETAHYLRVDNTDPSENAARKLNNQTDFAEEAKKFIQENESVFGVSSENFRQEEVYQRGGIWSVRFMQYVQDVPVYGSSLIFRYHKSGKLLNFGGTFYPGIVIDTTASLGSQTALDIAAGDLGLSSDSFTGSDLRLVIYPSTEEDNQNTSYRLCWEVNLTSRTQRKGWRYLIDAHDKTVVEGYDRARYAVSGKVQGLIFPKYPNQTIQVPFPNLKIMLLDKTNPLMYEDLGSDPGWSGTSLFGWGYGTPQPENNETWADPASGHTGSKVYGYNLQGSYPNNMPNREYLSTPAMSKAGEGGKIVLRFWRWLGVEGSDSDRATIEVSDFPGTWREVWSNPKDPIYDGTWKLISYDLSSLLTSSQNTLSIRWGLGTTNSYYNYCGWNLDDIGVYQGNQSVTNVNGSFTFTDEAQSNILDINLKGTYFQIRTTMGEGLVYTSGNVNRNSQDITINLKPASDYSVQTDTGVISASADIDELNAYYHSNRLIEYLRTIDPNFPVKNASSFPISVTVHNTAESTNSYWLEGDGIYLGEGNKSEYQDFSLFSDIIYHEVAHAVTDSIYKSNPFSNPSRFNQFDAMHEAFSDYWACTLNDDSQIAEGGFWTGGALRDLNNDLHYKLNYGDDLYESSLILSGAMWDLRNKLYDKYKGENGIKVADTLFLYAMYAEPVTYLDFLLDVLAVDEAKYNKVNRDLIQESFGRKGIAEPPSRPASILVTVDASTVKLSWERVDAANGYYLYYDISAIKALQPVSRYNPGGVPGSSGGTPGGGGTPGDGGSSGGWDNSGMDGTGGTPGGIDGTGSSSTRNLKNKVDVGDVSTYTLTNLQNNTTYWILLTAYNEYDIESLPSQNIYATPQDPNNTKPEYILVPSESSGKSKTCFISAIGSWF
ncbi:MAG: hypothetical protein AB1847_17710 [bacterium]